MKRILPSLALLLFITGQSFGQTKTWTGNQSTNWNNGNNWSPNGSPGATNDVIIPNSTSISNWPTLTLSGDVTIKSLTIKGRTSTGGDRGGSLTINAGNQPHTFTISGNLTINGSTGGNTETTNMGLVVSGGTTSRVTVTVGGNVTMTNGLANTKPTINIASGTLNIAGNITIGTNPTFSVSNGTVNYNGSSSQSISTQAVTYNNLILSGGGAKTLANNATATVTGTATFTNGILNTTSANLLTINNTATVTGASDNSFVQGPVKKVGNTAFTFPVGNVANGYHPLSISAAGTGFGTQNNAYTAEYVRANAHSVGNTIDNSLSAVSGCEYWNYTRNNGTSNPNVTLSWNAKSSCGGKYITTTFSLAIGYYNSGQSKWVQASGSTITYNSANPYTTGTITRNSLSSFGAITFASLNTGNASPLPVKFGDVKAYSVGTAVKVDWQAYNEVNVDHYEVERSTDGVHFSSIGSVAANNRTELSNYTLTDAAPVSGSSFYRIKNVDIDGKFSYSVIVKVSSSSEARMSLYPNPVKGTTVALQITGLQKGMYNLRVFNTTGQQVYGQQISHPGGNVTQSLQLPATLKPGVYNVQLSGTDVRWNRSLVVE